MLPDPLHPAIVHFPVVLAVILPFFAIGAVWAIRRGARPLRAWAIPLSMAAALAASAWLAVETGEAQDERIESVVSEKPLSAHEEMAETFLAGSVLIAAFATIGLVRGMTGRIARVATAAGSLVLVAGAARVGHSGGQLVYRYGAASAYASNAGSDTLKTNAAGAERRERSDRGNDDER